MVKKDKRTVVDAPTLTNPYDETCESYEPVIQPDWITSKQAIARINDRLAQNGQSISQDVFYHRLARGRIKGVKVGHRYYFDPKDIDALNFSPRRRKFVPPTKPVRVHSINELKQLAEKYGPLVDMEGFIEELEAHTHHRYTAEAIKQRLRRKTIWYVAYSGDKRKHTKWFPISQIRKMRLQPPPPEKIAASQ